jgi:VWFA-related protein
VRVTTRLVLVDVVVTDKSGQLLTNLPAEAFTVLEEGKPQPLASFQQPAPAAASAARVGQALPPNVYSNRPELHMPPGPLTFLLIDTLNTPVRDQGFARDQLLKYVATQLRGDQRVAVLTLGESLQVLQDFTGDPRLLLAAMDGFRPQRSIEESVTEATKRLPRFRNFKERRGEIDLAPLQKLVSSLHDFYEESARTALEVRVAKTIAAFQVIARAAGGQPGRKNLVWVTAAFPIAQTGKIVKLGGPDAGHKGQVSVERTFEEDLKRVAAELTDAQVAVYPVDARGLVGSTLADASTTGTDELGLVRTGESYGSQIRQSTASLQETQASMQQVADHTGGRVFANANDLEKAVGLSLAEGEKCYTLAYYPQTGKWDGKFRKIDVQVAGAGFTVRHRNGYFAVDPGGKLTKEEKKQRELDLANAMSPGTPLSTLVVFDARALPSGGAGKQTVPVEFLVDPRTLATEQKNDGGHVYHLEFHVAAYAAGGKLADGKGSSLDVPLKAADHAAVQQSGFPFRAELSLASGTYTLRFAVRDNRTGLLGSAEGSLTIP